MELKINVAFPSPLLFRVQLGPIFHEPWNPTMNKTFLFKWQGTLMYQYPGAESLKQTAADMWIPISANTSSGFLFLKALHPLDNLLP